MNLSRRTALQGAAGLIILPALGGVDSAEAFNLGGSGVRSFKAWAALSIMPPG